MDRLIFHFAVLAALLGSAIGAWFLTPYPTVNSLWNAARPHEPAAIAQHIVGPDLHAYSADHARQCLAELTGTPASGTAAATLSGFMHALSGATIETVIQQAISTAVRFPLFEGDTESEQAWTVRWQSPTRVKREIARDTERTKLFAEGVRRDVLPWKVDRIPFACTRFHR